LLPGSQLLQQQVEGILRCPEAGMPCDPVVHAASLLRAAVSAVGGGMDGCLQPEDRVVRIRANRVVAHACRRPTRSRA
jgi:hypothetical protein